MKRFIIFELLFSLALCYTMEPEQNVSRILCTYESIHRDLLKEHTAQYGLDPEDVNEWKEWEQIPKTIQKSLCNYYYDRQYQSYKNGCTKKGWAEGSVPSLLKFIGTPFDQNMLYENVPAITNVRKLMPQICLLKKIATVIPSEIQELTKQLLNYLKQYEIATLQKKIYLKTENNISALTCDNQNLFIGFYDGTIQIWDISKIDSQTNDTAPLCQYKAHSDQVRTLLSIQNYLISAGGTQQVAIPYYIPDLAGTITIWNKNTKKKFTLSERNDSKISHLCPIDDNHFASGSIHNVISIWNVTTGKKQHSCTLPIHSLNALSCSEKGFFASGPLANAHQDNDSIFYITNNLASMIIYKDSYKRINSIMFHNNDILICSGDDGITFLKDNNGSLEFLAQFCTKNPPLYNLVTLGTIGFYSTKNSIKTFNLTFEKKGYLCYTLTYKEKPTILTSFQEKSLISAYSNGDIIIWTPDNNCATLYQKSFLPEISLLQLIDESTIDQPTVQEEDSQAKSSWCTIQ